MILFRRGFSLLVLVAIASGSLFTPGLSAQDLSHRDLPTVGITDLSQRGGPNTTTVVDTVVDTLETVLTMTGQFQPIQTGTPSPTSAGGTSAAGTDEVVSPPDSAVLRGIADDTGVDNLITGSVQSDDDGKTVITLFAYNRQDEAVTVEVREEAETIFSVFDAVDRAVIALLEGFTGEPVTFGTLALSGDWQPSRDRILLDGAAYDVRGDRVPGLLARRYQLVVTRRSGTGEVAEVLRRSIEIEPEGITTVAIPLREVSIGSVEFAAGELSDEQIILFTPLGDIAEPPTPDTPQRGTIATLGQDLAGGTLVIYNYPGWYQPVIDAFQEETGIAVQRAPDQRPDWRIDLAIEGEPSPHLAFIPQPGPAFDLLQLGLIDNLYRVFDRRYLDQFYRKDILAFGHPQPYYDVESDRSVGLSTTVNLKSLYWYAPSIFAAEGIEVPATADELDRVVSQLNGTDRATYSFAIQSNPATGWMITDWIEDRILQSASLDEYDAWSRGQLSFRAPIVEETTVDLIEMFGQPGMMFRGVGGVTGRSFTNTLEPLVRDEPAAALAFGPSFLIQWHSDSLDRISFFPTPPATPGGETRRLVGGDMVIIIKATDEARAFIRYLNRPETVQILIEGLEGEGQIGNVATHNSAVPDLYREPQRTFAKIVGEADVLRYDASDRMNREVGMERFLTGVRSMAYGSDIVGVLNSIDRVRRSSLR